MFPHITLSIQNRKKRSAGEKTEIVARPHTIKELAHACPGRTPFERATGRTVQLQRRRQVLRESA